MPHTPPFVGNVVRCRFTSSANDTIEVLFDRNEKNHVYYVTVNPDDVSFQALLNDGWDLERISNDTLEWNRSQSRALNDAISHFVKAGRKEIRQEFEKKFQAKIEEHEESKPIDKNALVRHVIDNNEKEDAIFKAKLAIFDMDEVKSVKDRSGKLKIRKGKTLLATFAALHDLLEG